MNQYTISKIESWVKWEDVKLSTPFDSSSPYLFILVDYQELITKDRVSKFKRTIEIINDESRIEDASLYITELKDNHHLLFHSIDILRNGKVINALIEENISTNQRELSLENHITDNNYTISLSIDDLRVGDIIDYQTTTVIYANNHPVDGKYYHSHFWLNWNCPVNRQIIRINNQSNKDIVVQTCIIHDGIPSSKSECISHNQSLEKEFTDVKPSLIEDTAPDWLWPDFLLASTHSTWTFLSSYLYNFYKSQGLFGQKLSLNVIPDFNPDDNIKTKAIKIVRFVQNHIRYKGENYGIYTHTPKQPNRTLNSRHGDCKDKSILLLTLLKSANVKANLALCNTEYGVKISKLTPSLFLFNHVIVHFEIDGKDYFFDPTIKKQFGDLDHSSHLNYGFTLMLSDEGMKLQSLRHDLSKKVFHLKHIFDFTQAQSDENILTINRRFYNHRADNMRYYLYSNQREILTDEFLKQAKKESDLELLVVKPISIIDDNMVSNEIEKEEIYKIINLTNDDGKELHQPTNLHLEFPVSTSRVHPLRIDLDGKITHEIKVIYKYQAIAEPEETRISNQWFTYSDSVHTKKNILYLTATAEPHMSYVDTNDIQEYLPDVEKMKQRSMNNFFYKSCDFSLLYKMRISLITYLMRLATRLERYADSL